MTPFFRLAALIIAVALFPRGEARAQTKIANDDAGFSFVIPAGYQRAERLRTRLPYALYEYATDLDDVRATTLLVTRMEGPVRQGSDIVSEHLKMPFWVIGSGPRTRITETWKGFDIPAVRMVSRAKTPSGPGPRQAAGSGARGARGGVVALASGTRVATRRHAAPCGRRFRR